MDIKARALEMYKAIEARKEKERQELNKKEKLANEYCGSHWRRAKK